MYFVNGLKMMYEQFITKISSIDFNSMITKYAGMVSDFINNYLSGVDNLRMIATILMIIATIMFLFLVIIVFVKSFFSSLKSNKTSSSEDDIFDEEDAKELDRIIEDQEKEIELEKELQKELEMAQAGRERSQKKERKIKDNEEKKKKEKEEEKEKEEQKEDVVRQQKSRSREIDLDWKKGNQQSQQNDDVITLNPENLSYHQTNLGLNELTGLIIDMIARGVDDLKIAQTIMYRNHYASSEEDVLQLVEAIKEFVSICRNGYFEDLKNQKDIPSEEQALYHLSEGDPSLALFMLEKLMDSNIDMAGTASSETKKEALYGEISTHALVFGNLAAINDIHLATGSFELAIELEPHNISAWSRLADMYAKAETSNKAIWAYQKILDMADEEINPREVANAQKNLSQHLYAQGNSLQAAKLYNNSKQYYDSLGINRRLDKQELEIISIIENNHRDEISFTIQKLLGREAGTGFSFD